MNWRDRIVADPEVLVGKPVIRGTRISAEFVLELLAAGYSTADVLSEYDHLQDEDVHACLTNPAEVIGSERMFRLPA